MTASALRILAGPRARQHLRDHGLRPQDVRVIAAAAGGPKGLVLNPLDRFLFGSWLAGSSQPVHLIGASIGSWRMSSACMADPDKALAEMAEDYITQDYAHAPGRSPAAAEVSRVFGQMLAARLGVRASEVTFSQRLRLHVVTSRGRHLLHRQGPWRTMLGYAGAFATNALNRQWLGLWLERVIFSDPREALPFALTDYPSRTVPLTAGNLVPAVLASCSIPFWLDAVHDIPGGPAGAYWDGGITDYHLHLPYAGMQQGLVLYPHFATQLVPGWLDKSWKRRHGATSALDNVVVLAPHPDWIRRLPNAKLPDRADFTTYRDDFDGRVKVWRRALAESQRLADEFARRSVPGQPLEAEALT